MNLSRKYCRSLHAQISLGTTIERMISRLEIPTYNEAHEVVYVTD
ncbi:MAG: sulfopyruvate decarboxylase TPP-binding subunit [Polaribacter sp.]|jgi:sulfopyruvate decarboxylase TPP-binding subunit